MAFLANLLVAIAKTVASVLVSSSSLRTEAVHSWVDVGNEVSLVAAARSAQKPSDLKHPLGYGRASYVWSLFASLGTLLGGAVFGMWEGIRQLTRPEAATEYLVGYSVIAVSFLIEGASFVQTLRQVRKGADALDRDIFEHAFISSNSPMRAVFAEDLTALIGLAMAALGMLLHQLTGKPVYDAAGSIAIGLLMAVAAALLIARNATFLSGQSLSMKARTRLIEAIRAFPEVARVTFVYTEFIGPERCLVIAGVGLSGDHDQHELAHILRTIEQGLMKRQFIGLAIMTLATREDADITC